jgi:drug/metabolite transporter (DMT)-like permease
MIFTATSLKEPSKTMPLGYISIIVGFFADVIYFDVQFNSLAIIGMLLTSGGLLSRLFIPEDKTRINSS